MRKSPTVYGAKHGLHAIGNMVTIGSVELHFRATLLNGV